MKALKLVFAAAAALLTVACCNQPKEEGFKAADLKLTDYEPVSMFKLPEHRPPHAKFTAIDMHSHHVFATDLETIKEWVKLMDDNNIERTVIFTAAHGEEFDRLYDMFKGVSDRFEIWCGINFDDWGTPDFERTSVEELIRCHEKGAKGIGEMGDKGWGEAYFSDKPKCHVNDPRLDPVLEKCGELGMPINVHEGDPIWMYEPMDEHNDGYMNSWAWRIDATQEGLMGLYDLVGTLEEACDKHPNTTFIGCHFCNISHDYESLSKVMDRHPNLYLDNSARIVETCVTPRATKAFYEKYQDRILFGTDNLQCERMYDLQWRCLETEDEHFYDKDPNFFATENSIYHWPLHGIGLSDECLKKIYHDNAVKIMGY